MLKAEEGGSVRQRVLRSVRWMLVAKVAGQAISLGTTLWLAGRLDQTAFGLMAMAVTCMGLLDHLVDFGFLAALVQRPHVTRPGLSGCFWLLQALSVILCLAVLAACPWLASAFNEPRLTSLLTTMAWVLVLAPAQIVARSSLSRALRLDRMTQLEIVAGLLRSGVAIMLARSGWGVTSLVYGYLADKAVMAIGLPMLARWYPGLVCDWTEVRTVLVKGSQMTAGSLLWYLYTRADSFVVGRVLGTEALGIYALAQQLAQSIQQFLLATFFRMVYPLLARFQQKPEFPQVFMQASAYLFAISVPLLLGLSGLAVDLVPVLLGDKWQAVIGVVTCMCWVVIVDLMAALFPQAFNALGRPGLNIALNLLTVLLALLLYPLGAYAYGLLGVVAAAWILFVVKLAVSLWFAGRILPLPWRDYLRGLRMTALAGGLMYVVVMVVHGMLLYWPLTHRLTACVLTGAGIYLLAQALCNRELTLTAGGHLGWLRREPC